MKVIFLDIDGVLNCIGSFNRTKTRFNGFVGMDPTLVARFNSLVEKTGARVVLSSTWRLDPKWSVSCLLPDGETAYREARVV